MDFPSWDDPVELEDRLDGQVGEADGQDLLGGDLGLAAQGRRLALDQGLLRRLVPGDLAVLHRVGASLGVDLAPDLLLVDLVAAA